VRGKARAKAQRATVLGARAAPERARRAGGRAARERVRWANGARMGHVNGSRRAQRWNGSALARMQRQTRRAGRAQARQVRNPHSRGGEQPEQAVARGVA
jgi:hypothetical protein